MPAYTVHWNVNDGSRGYPNIPGPPNGVKYYAMNSYTDALQRHYTLSLNAGKKYGRIKYAQEIDRGRAREGRYRIYHVAYSPQDLGSDVERDVKIVRNQFK